MFSPDSLLCWKAICDKFSVEQVVLKGVILQYMVFKKSLLLAIFKYRLCFHYDRKYGEELVLECVILFQENSF